MTFPVYKKRSPLNLKAFILGLILLAAPLANLLAQPIPVGGLRDDQFRVLQLLSDSTITTSFTNRPVFFSTYNHLFNNSNSNREAWWGHPLAPAQTIFSLRNYDISLGAYEPVLTTTYNTKLPYGENNGAAWYGRGLNTEFQGGFYVKSKYATITFRPHLIYTQNRDFPAPLFVPKYDNGDIRYSAPGFLPEYKLSDLIDRPFRFGPDPYYTLDWGQSSVRLHYKQIEIGVSKGDLWWGPGNQYALALSNNAPGLLHGFIGTRKPITLPLNIGDIEFRWILAQPQDSKYFDLGLDSATPDSERIKKEKLLSHTRFLNGLNISYSPSFLPNLSIGLIRIIQQYVPDGGLSVSDILGVFEPFPKPSSKAYEKTPYDESYYENSDPVSSYYFRWVLPESDAEFYGEFYKGDHNRNLRDALTEPQHGRAYTIGVQKLLEFDGAINFVKINAEINELVPGIIDYVRPQTYFYTHHAIKQGLTNRGQVLGAAIGPGSASQYISVDGYFKKAKLGIFAQREVINNHFHYERLERFFPGGGFKDQFHHRENFNFGLTGSYKFNHILLKGKLVWNRNFNYGRNNLGQPSFYTFPIYIVDNYQGQLSIQYLF